LIFRCGKLAAYPGLLLLSGWFMWATNKAFGLFEAKWWLTDWL
jgi:hypothetical protein